MPLQSGNNGNRPTASPAETLKLKGYSVAGVLVDLLWCHWEEEPFQLKTMSVRPDWAVEVGWVEPHRSLVTTFHVKF